MSAKPINCPVVEPACPAKRSRKPRGPNTFKQHDVTRAVRAVQAAGVEVARVEVDKDGKIVVIAGKPQQQPQSPADTAANAYDEWRRSCAESN
jgi:hypothetical protein